MKLCRHRLELHFHHEFRIARGGSSGTPTWLVELRDDEFLGRGECVPVGFYGWTMDSIAAALDEAAALLADEGPADPEDLQPLLRDALGDQMAAVCAVDGALWDLWGQRCGEPVWRLLDTDPTAAGLTSFTIGLAPLEEMLSKAAEAAEYPILKVKCGGPEDLATIRALREATGKRLWVDANCGWSVDQAGELAGELAELGVELIEQPVGRDDLAGLAAVRERSPLPIIADESCHVPEDVAKLVGCVDGVNVKLEKAGGITGGLAVIEAAWAAGLQVMVGCFCASSVSLTMAAQLAPLADWCDLDGHLLVADDPFRGMTAAEGRIMLPQRPGLGVAPRS